MRRRWFMAVAALVGACVGAPARASDALPPPGAADSHQAYVRTVKSAERRAYRDALAVFDARLRRAPDDAVAAVERCKLIAGLLPNDEDERDDDEDGESSARESSFGDCLKMLEERFSRAPVALVYRLSRTWGKESIGLANQLLADPQLVWTRSERATIYEKLARGYEFDKQRERAADAAERAMALDPTLDLTTIVASEWISEGRTSEAIVALSARPDGSPYWLMQKARLLADAGAPSRALWMLELARKRGSSDPALAAKLFERVGKLDLARREYMEMKGPWKREAALAHLFALDFAGGDAASAASSYQAMRDLGWRLDPFGAYRLALARRFRGIEWRPRDWAGVLGFTLLLLFSLLVPGLWIVPMHYWSLARRLRGPLVEQPTLATRWRFRELWAASAGFLVAEMVCLELFDYDELSSWIHSAAERPAAAVSATAAYGIWHAALVTLVLAAILVRRRDLRLFGPGAWSVLRSIGGAAAAMGVLAVIAILMLAAVRALGSGAPATTAGALTTENVIDAVRQVYGVGGVIVVAVIAAPITEELIFRSVMLDVFARYTPFFVANGTQALLFAAAHGEARRMPYLFVVGIACGWLRRRSGGLLASITLHAMNNTLATLLVFAFMAPPPPTKSAAPSPPPRLVLRPAPPVTVSTELAACMRATHGKDALPPEALNKTTGFMAASLLNRAAWAMAVDPSTSPDCLRQAAEAVNGALRRGPEDGSVLDTKATVYLRQGLLDEAVDLERAAIERSDHRAFYSQLDRFLRARRAAGGSPVLGAGSIAPVEIALEPASGLQGQAISIRLGDELTDGGYLYALVTSGDHPVGVVRAVFGPGHAASYRLQPQQGLLMLPADARFDVALLDARGCDGCARGTWSWEFQLHDFAVDAYPR